MYISKEFQHFGTKDIETVQFVRHRGQELDEAEPTHCLMEMEISHN
jgi:hypothetical protein